MQFPKIHLSSAEMDLMQNATIILTKNHILEKIKRLLETLQYEQLKIVHANDIQYELLFLTPPKISKGENYLGLPYLMLDYPRHSNAAGLFFIRTMFWWGNFFSVTLHLSGIYKEAHKDQIKKAYLQLPDHFIGINPDPWIHHFDENNYKKVNTLSENKFEQYCATTEHVKIAVKWPLSVFDHAPEVLLAQWKYLLACVNQLPSR